MGLCVCECWCKFVGVGVGLSLWVGVGVGLWVWVVLCGWVCMGVCVLSIKFFLSKYFSSKQSIFCEDRWELKDFSCYKLPLETLVIIPKTDM